VYEDNNTGKIQYLDPEKFVAASSQPAITPTAPVTSQAVTARPPDSQNVVLKNDGTVWSIDANKKILDNVKINPKIKRIIPIWLNIMDSSEEFRSLMIVGKITSSANLLPKTGQSYHPTENTQFEFFTTELLTFSMYRNSIHFFKFR